MAGNRAKKITLRKQMASIANQLAEIGRAWYLYMNMKYKEKKIRWN